MSTSDSATFTATVSEQGRLQLPASERQAMDRFLSRLAGKPVAITVKRERATRSNQANRWYWGCVLALLAEHTGYTPEELHEYCKARFLPKRLALCDGNGVVVDDRVIGGTTTSLNTKEMAEYADAIRDFAARDLGVAIPDPDPAWRAVA